MRQLQPVWFPLHSQLTYLHSLEARSPEIMTATMEELGIGTKGEVLFGQLSMNLETKKAAKKVFLNTKNLLITND